MKRELKFRALCEVEYKDSENKNILVYFTQLELDNGLWYSPDDENIYHINEWLSKPMQYTGLKDKNGVEIYFCDIVSKYHYDILEDRDIRVVEQIEGHTEIGCFSYYEDSADFTVIGNIHENPELSK